MTTTRRAPRVTSGSGTGESRTALKAGRTLSLFGAAVLLSLGLGAAPSSAETVTTAACDGVTVIVDFTDLGGQVESGCAEGDPETGREALESAGFTAVNGPSGYICTIDAQPDPCPTEFGGSFWAYWELVDGEWVSSQVGADASDPQPGGFEGWRYNDGSVPPPMAEVAPTQTTDATTDEQSSSDAEEAGSGISPGLWTAIGVVIVALVAGLVIRRSRRSA